MDVLEFRLRGETAFFKIPQLNAYRYMTYSCIHKVALMGIFGSILGLGGYGQQEGPLPEFYQRLESVRVSIEIEDLKEIKKKFQQFNNSVGYASEERGNNLIVTEQWLEKPSWKIRLLADSLAEDLNLVERIENHQASFPPYLGKNDHFANLEDIRRVHGQRVEDLSEERPIQGLLAADDFSISLPRRQIFRKYEESLPVGLDRDFNQYLLKKFCQSNGLYRIKESSQAADHLLVELEGQAYYFF